MADGVRHLPLGCIVEYMEGNASQIALITKNSGGHLRLLLPNRREISLAAARLLPWLGPTYKAGMNREEGVRLLAQHKKTREERAAAIAPLEVWKIVQDELSEAPAQWFAELFSDAPDEDTVAACGRALLACKSHFHFQPPDFLVYSTEMAKKRLDEQQARDMREALVTGGASFFRLLWDLASKKRVLSPRGSIHGPQDAPVSASVSVPELTPDVEKRLKVLLRARMRNPEDQECDALWQMLAKGLPALPHVPFQLLKAWGEVPEHYNFWLDRAGYTPGDAWWQPYAGEVQDILEVVRDCRLPECDLPFISIDSASTRDMDDAFFVERANDGFTLTLVLAAPAIFWPFDSQPGHLNKTVLHRATSIYLPEGTCHMLPEILGTNALSLVAGQARPALCVRLGVDASAAVSLCEIFVAKVNLAANLNYTDCQSVLDAQTPQPDNPASAYAEMLRAGRDLAILRQRTRIAGGAVIMNRPDPVVHLRGEDANVVVSVEQEKPSRDTQNLVAEMMILASAAVADWAAERNIPLLHRTQDVTLPKEYAGVWTKPEDMFRIMRALAPSCLEIRARRHAALAIDRYAPITSPLRRYADLINEAQTAYFLCNSNPLWDEAALERLLLVLDPVLEAAGQAQRFRLRYWKLLYFRQQGDKVWWPGVITEENDAVVNVSLPEQGIFVRGRRQLFDERACPGIPVSVRLGKINPLYNEIQILEATS